MNRIAAETYLKIIEIANYIVAIVVVPYFFFTLIKTIFPLFGIFAFDSDSGFWVIILMIPFIVIPLSFIASILFSARYINRRINYTYSLVIACLECFATTYGFILGVATLILFSQPEVKRLYNLE